MKLPRYEEIEKNVIGICITNPSLIDKYDITVDEFYESRDQMIFKSILDMRAKGIKIGDVELRQHLIDTNLIKKVSGGFPYIGSLTDNASENYDIDYQVRKLKEASRQRQLWKYGHKLSQLIEKEADQKEIDELRANISRVDGSDSMIDCFNNFKQKFHPAMDVIHNSLVYGIPNGKTPVFINDRKILHLSDISKTKHVDVYPEQSRFSKEGIDKYLNKGKIDPVILYESIRDLLLKYIIFQHEWQVDLTVIWIMGTYVHRCFPLYPYYWIKSPTKRCGKTRLLEIMAGLCFNADGVETAPTEAVLFRLPAITGGTLLWDEAESLFKQKEKGDLISVLNTAYRKEGIIRRCEGKDHKIRTHGVYRPVALAGISTLPDTVSDRSLKVELIRKRGDEKVGRLQIERLDNKLQKIRDDLHIFALSNAHIVIEAYNQFQDNLVPEGVDDRLRDAFEVMLSIAAPILFVNSDHSILTQLKKAALALSGIRSFDEEDNPFITAIKILKAEIDKSDDDYLILTSDAAVNLFRNGGIDWVAEKKDARSILRKYFKIRSDSHRVSSEEVVRGYKITKKTIEDLYLRYVGSYIEEKSVQSVTN